MRRSTPVSLFLSPLSPFLLRVAVVCVCVLSGADGGGEVGHGSAWRPWRVRPACRTPPSRRGASVAPARREVGAF